MTRKLKLGIGALGFLGINGIMIPVLENNLKIFNPLKMLNWGGRQDQREN